MCLAERRNKVQGRRTQGGRYHAVVDASGSGSAVAFSASWECHGQIHQHLVIRNAVGIVCTANDCQGCRKQRPWIGQCACTAGSSWRCQGLIVGLSLSIRVGVCLAFLAVSAAVAIAQTERSHLSFGSAHCALVMPA